MRFVAAQANLNQILEDTPALMVEAAVLTRFRRNSDPAGESSNQTVAGRVNAV
jgi:hypothetical protein